MGNDSSKAAAAKASAKAAAEGKRVGIDCPYTERDQAKGLGAQWDHSMKTWYLPPGCPNFRPFSKWLPKGFFLALSTERQGHTVHGAEPGPRPAASSAAVLAKPGEAADETADQIVPGTMPAPATSTATCAPAASTHSNHSPRQPDHTTPADATKPATTTTQTPGTSSPMLAPATPTAMLAPASTHSDHSPRQPDHTTPDHATALATTTAQTPSTSSTRGSSRVVPGGERRALGGTCTPPANPLRPRRQSPDAACAPGSAAAATAAPATVAAAATTTPSSSGANSGPIAIVDSSDDELVAVVSPESRQDTSQQRLSMAALAPPPAPARDSTAAATVSATAGIAPRVYECERDCGFLGSFGAVAAHESQPCTDTAARSAPKCSFADAFDYYRVLECNTCHIAVPASAGIWTTSQRSGGRCAACLLCSSDDDSDNDELARFLAGRG